MRSFKPAWWLRNPHLQTIAPHLSRKCTIGDLVWEEIQLPDGDFLDLAWAGVISDKPIIVLLPGLEGDASSSYIVTLTQCLVRHGYRVAVMHNRSCGGRINRMARTYHGGVIDDLHAVLANIRMQNPGHEVYALAFSLGANILINYLAQEGLATHSKSLLDRSIAVSVPFDLAACADHMAMFYQRHFLKTMKRKIAEKINKRYDMPLSLAELEKIKTLRQFDDQVTAPLFAYDSAEDYYEQASCTRRIHAVKAPLSIIHALDDVIVPNSCIPEEAQFSESTNTIFTKHGGHLGFIAGAVPFRPKYWLHEMVLELLYS